jgi:alpha-tubulin suppressor-like RCC1 family protein
MCNRLLASPRARYPRLSGGCRVAHGAWGERGDRRGGGVVVHPGEWRGLPQLRRDDGRQAYCWGGNTFGQLGNGTTTHSVVPVAVLGGLRFRHVNVGYDHTCGLTTDNLAYCWGLNMWGQIGDGTKGSDNWRTIPTAVVGGRRYRMVRAGWSHTCAISMLDVAWCWGFNGNGQLGDGTTTAEGRAKPVRVLGSQVWKQLSGGAEHTCGVTTADQAYCWGLNDRGQLGIGNTTRRLQPAPV